MTLTRMAVGVRQGRLGAPRRALQTREVPGFRLTRSLHMFESTPLAMMIAPANSGQVLSELR
jgi:hypothetical protein